MTGEERSPMAEEEEGRLVFEALRPFCVKVMWEACVENLSRLQVAVKTLPQHTDIPSQLVPYLTVPLRTALKKAGR